MRIVVIVGRVLDPSGIVVNARRGRLFINREEYILQPADGCALEAALRVKDAIGAEVVALPRSPSYDDDVLRQALAAGVDRAVSITGDNTFKAADEAVMAAVLAAAVQRIGGADLILTGTATLDTRQGQLGPRLAGLMACPQIIDSWKVEVTDGAVQAVQKRGPDFVIVEASLPAVVTVAPEAPSLRYANGARLINVYRAADAVETWLATDLVGESSLQAAVQRMGQDFPQERERGTRLRGSPDEMALALAEALLDRV